MQPPLTAVAQQLLKARRVLHGLYPVEILTPIAMLEASDWDIHVKEQWGIYAGEMPDQDEFMKRMNDGDVVYGPFGGY